ncbi:MAG: ABC transporter substrate-binding protein [Chloroflexota bacterium]|nr:ABC transporter substrate-binding protein [Chloroflexota bacterium]
MATLPIRIITRNYYQVEPLATGEVIPDGIDLTLDRSVPMTAFLDDESIPAGEMSFAQYVRRKAAGDTEVVGLPIFAMRGFRQRCFFVRRGSPIQSFKDLAGKRVGTNGWPDSGNTWSRSLVRREGVELDQVEWWVGPIDDTTGKRTAAADLPPIARPLPDGKHLVGMLVAGELDAIVIPWPPKTFYDAESPIVRLLHDFRHAEQDYARQLGFYPGLHIVGVRSAFVQQHPWVARSLFNAFEAAWRLSEDRLWAWTDSTPWLLDDLEQIRQIVGPDWQAHGVTPNRTMIQTFCDEVAAQGLIERPLSVDDLFSEFEHQSA